MQLKEYQAATIEKVKLYLEKLAAAKTEYDTFRAMNPRYHDDYVQNVWTEVTGLLNYASKKNGLDEYLPNFCLKVPTGGGKTLLATHTIDSINKYYLRKRTGFVLWIVPTNAIYTQTFRALKDREHPYRQVLDLSSGGRTLILERQDNFTPDDVRENLVVMLFMLPAANRQNKETLKTFRDSGSFTDFFPAEDDLTANETLLKKFPNLDYFGKPGQAWGRQIKTSLGNTLRFLQPVIIIDEGQKAYSEGAQSTIRGFNPAIMVELSATPNPASNKLVEIHGQELNREQMIKLDINVTNKKSANWKDTLLSSVEKRNFLEEKAREYEANMGIYIRPINLIQVERTGKDQIGSGFIHAEDAKRYLIEECLIPADHIAIKSSEKDDIEGINLYSKDCNIRYIITKQALQEGWDCSFAYALTILTNPKSENAITQLVGRILRQPNARKTGIKDLDECYVFCFQQNAGTLMKSIKQGLEGEGLGDLAGRVTSDEAGDIKQQDVVGYRDHFKKFEGKIYLPHFIIQETDGWRELRYEMDLVSQIDWSKINYSSIGSLTLTHDEEKDEMLAVGLSSDTQQLIEKKATIKKQGGLKIDLLFITRHLNEVIPNPWVAYKITEEGVKLLKKKNDETLIASNLVFIVEELIKILKTEKDKQAEIVFKDLLEKKKVCFLLQKGTGFRIPKNIKVTRSNILFNTHKGEPIQKSLFDKTDKDNMNEFEESVAICMDEQDKLLWWYRNIARADYYVQGWKQHKIYPDFIAAKEDKKNKTDYSKVYVLETKGVHLKNEDTAYKKSIFEICNEHANKKPWGELELEFSQKEFEFQVVFDDVWRKRVNELFI